MRPRKKYGYKNFARQHAPQPGKPTLFPLPAPDPGDLLPSGYRVGEKVYFTVGGVRHFGVVVHHLGNTTTEVYARWDNTSEIDRPYIAFMPIDRIFRA